LQQTTLTTLDVTARCVIISVQKVLPFGVLLLEGQDGQTWKDHVHNCAPCHLPNLDGQMDPCLAVVPTGLQCMLCGQALRAAAMLICDKCSRGWHIGCLMPQMEEVLVRKWIAPWCTQ
jgi:hypothetical protein